MPAVMIPSEVAGAVREQHQTYLERCGLKGDRLCRRRQDRPAGSLAATGQQPGVFRAGQGWDRQ